MFVDRRLLASLTLFAAAATAACSNSPTSPTAAVPAQGTALAAAAETSSGTTGATSGATAVDPASTYVIQTTYTAPADLVAGTVVTLNITLTNVGAVTDPYGAFGWVLLPKNVKRQGLDATTGSPRISCEAYRGHQGGLSQAVYDDFCRIWFDGPFPAGGAQTLALPVKLLAAGDFNTVAEMSWGVPNGGLYPNLQRLLLDLHVVPAPPKPAGGGGGGTTSGLPDLQVTAKASSGSPAVGALFTTTFTAKNSGKGEASNAMFVATVPAGLTALDASVDGQPCALMASGAGTNVTCPGVPVILVGQAMTLTLTATGAAPGAFSLSATATAANGDSAPANNTGSLNLTIK